MSPMRLNILFVGIVTAMTGGFTAGILMPGVRDLSRSRHEVSEAADRTRQAQATAGEEPTIYQAILDLQNELAESRRHVPPERQFGEFLNEVSEALRALNVANYELRPLSEHPLVQTQSGGTGQLTGRAFVLPVRIKIQCSFKTMFEFLTRLSEMPRLARVAAIEIDTADSRSPRVQVRLLVEAYYCPEDEGAPAAGSQEDRP